MGLKLFVLCVAISTALPTIARTLNSREFAWAGNAYSIASTAVIPW